MPRAKRHAAIPRPKRDAIGDKKGSYPALKPKVQRPGPPRVGWKGLGVYRHVLSSTSKVSAKAARPTRTALDPIATGRLATRATFKRWGVEQSQPREDR